MKTLQAFAQALDEKEAQHAKVLLTDEQVRAIRNAPKEECHGDVAARVGCLKGQVSRVRARRSYQWISDNE